MNLAIKELADTKFEVVLWCCLSILNLFPLTSTLNIFLCGNLSCKVNQVEDSEFAHFFLEIRPKYLLTSSHF